MVSSCSEMMNFTKSPIENDASHLSAFHDCQVSYALLCHDGHAFIQRVLRSHIKHGARHDLFHFGFFRRSFLKDDFASIVALGEIAPTSSPSEMTSSAPTPLAAIFSIAS